MRVRSVTYNHFLPFSENLVKISPVYPDVIDLKWGPLKTENVTEAEYNSALVLPGSGGCINDGHMACFIYPLYTFCILCSCQMSQTGSYAFVQTQCRQRHWQ